MKRKKVSELAKQIRGVSYKPEDLHENLDESSVTLLRANNIFEGRISFDDVIYVDKSRVASGSKQLVGKAASFNFDTECTFGAFCKVVRPNQDVANYLSVYFQSNAYRQKISEVAIGANINNIRNEHIDALELPIGSNAENEEVVASFSSLQQIIDSRKQQLHKLDELVKARFVELFGDPVKNSKRLPTVLGETLFRLSNGKALPSNERFPEGIPAYGGNGVSWYTDKILCDFDTIIVGRVGFQSGNVHLAKAPLWVTDNAMYISSLNTEICDMRFLCALMEHMDFTRYQDAGDLKKITQKPFMQMHYPMPSMQSQMQYIDFSEQIDKSKVAVQKALDEAQLLFDSLMQKYFG